MPLTLALQLFIENEPCLVIGGGRTGAHKAGVLLEAGANVTVMAPELDDRLQTLADSGDIQWLPSLYRNFILTAESWKLVVSTTDNRTVEEAVIRDCRERQLWVASATLWKDGDFIFPATFKKEPFHVSVSTDGKSCKEAKRLKEKLKDLPEDFFFPESFKL
jgi:uroporphyrin-III C-methyltransferase/precorrin-2 dehydrogenase/sirohydrochlorin ferrochelatase